MASYSPDSYEPFTEEQDSYSIVVAIDFGTTYSGYAFSFKTSQNDIIMYKDWGNCMGMANAFKAPTCVLTDQHDRFVAFGYEAQKKYTEMMPEEAENYHFYEKFKMQLHKNVNRKMKVVSTSGHQASALDIFAMVLKYLADHVFNTIHKHTGSTLERNSVQWVVTVPAIWSNASKQFMREAAFMAGLTTKLDSKQLIIALEPEAASLYCHQMESQFSQLKPWTQYLVLDCGGGTLDITAHKILDDNRIGEIYQANGGSLGGSEVDREFEELLKHVFGAETINKVMTESPGVWLEMMVNFERKKRAFKAKDKTETVNITLSYEFVEVYQSTTSKSIKNAIPKEYKDMGISFGSGMLRIPCEVMKRLFKKVVDGIVDHVTELMKRVELKKITHILLVGGFGECNFLQECITRVMGKHVKIIVPPDTSQSVLKGAVFYGHKPMHIAMRICSKTIGMIKYSAFDAAVHDEAKKLRFGTVEFVKDAFHKFVAKGEIINYPKVIKESFVPMLDIYESVDIALYQTDKKNPMYVDEVGIEKIGQIELNLPGQGTNREVIISLTFGSTEIEVEAKDPRPGGDIVSCILDFLSCDSLN